MSIERNQIKDFDHGVDVSTGPSDVTKVLIGLLAGAAVGSLVGGAFTRKGVEVRSRVVDGSKNLANNIREKFSTVTGSVADKYTAAKEGATDFVEKGKQKIGATSAGSSNSDNTMVTKTAEPEGALSSGGIWLGTLIVSVASTIVWSFATERGNETRRRMAQGGRIMANNVKEKVSNVAGSIADGISSTYQAAKEGAAEILEKEKAKRQTEV